MKKSSLKRKTPLKARRGFKKPCTLANKFQNSKAWRSGDGIGVLAKKNSTIKRARSTKKTHLNTKSSSFIPKGVKDVVLLRSGGRCEVEGCALGCNGILDFMHLKHRGMGGRKGEIARMINDARNIVLVHRVEHDIYDKRIKYDESKRAEMEEYLKCKAKWDEWEAECHKVVNKEF